MSIIVKGMEMPKSCYACELFAQTDYWNKEDEADILSRCKRTGEKTWESVNGYLPNCPLVPVPAHGRLIDADALDGLLADMAKKYPKRPLDSIGGYWIDKFRNMLKAVPTIIPASK